LTEPAPATPAPPAEEPAAPQTEAAVTPEAQPSQPVIEEVAPVRPRPASRPRRKKPPEAPDAWKKGIPIFGGG
jgi:hypothetical protein